MPVDCFKLIILLFHWEKTINKLEFVISYSLQEMYEKVKCNV